MTTVSDVGASSRGLTKTILFWLGFVGIFNPMATDIYLPALPVMAKDLIASPEVVQLGLATSSLGMAAGTLFVGVLSDRFGRRKPLISTGMMMVGAASLAALSMNVAWFLTCCLVMGLAASSVQVAGRGVVADLTVGRATTRAYSLINSIVMVGPIVGPVGGVLLLSLAGWRAIFVVVAVFAIIGTFGVWAFIPETLPVERRQTHGLGSILKAMGAIWRHRTFTLFAIVSFAAFALNFTYLATCSLVIQVEFGAPAWIAAVAFAINGVGLVTAGIMTAKLTTRMSSVSLVFLSIAGQLLSIGYLAGLVFTGSLSLPSVFFIYFLICFSFGILFGPVTSLVLTHVRSASGTALGLLGLVQFMIAAATSFFVGTVGPDPVTSMLTIGTAAVVIATIAALLGRRALIRDPDPAREQAIR